MIDSKEIDGVLNVLYKNTSNNHITTVEYACKEVFKNDKNKCDHTIDYMITLGFIKFVKDSTSKIQLEYAGKEMLKSGGYANKIIEDERQRVIEKEKEERKEEEKEVKTLKEQKKNRKAIYLSGIIGVLLSNLDRLIPWLKSLLGL